VSEEAFLIGLPPAKANQNNKEGGGRCQSPPASRG
jgi:hypothetical protein